MGGYLGNQPDAIKPPTLIFSNTTGKATAGTSEESLVSYTMPANKLAGNGHKLRIVATGTTAADGDNKTVLLKFGSVTIIDSTAIAANDKDWKVEAEVLRTGSATQDIYASGLFNDALIIPVFTAGTEDLTSSVVIDVRGTTPTTAGDLTCENLTVELIET